MAALSDMGGRSEFFGPIAYEQDEPVFYSRAEARVFGISGVVLTLFGGNVDAFRFAEERLSGDIYLSSYYRIRVWDSSAEARYMVLPERPPGTDGMGREQLEKLVTRDAMIGVARALSPDAAEAA